MIEKLRKILNIILPPRCLKCGIILSEHNGLCAECFQKIKFISEPVCKICGFPLNGQENSQSKICAVCTKNKKHIIEKQRTVFVYDDFSKSIIIDLKFHDKTYYAETLAKMLYNAGRDIWKENPDILVPVPIHQLRLLKRRYNQSALLVKYLSVLCNVKADYVNLYRIQNTVPQMKLKGAMRRKNLLHAFAANSGVFNGKKVVIIDDVSKTGSTLNECAKVLKKAGAIKVYALTLARTIE